MSKRATPPQTVAEASTATLMAELAQRSDAALIVIANQYPSANNDDAPGHTARLRVLAFPSRDAAMTVLGHGLAQLHQTPLPDEDAPPHN